MPSRPDQRGTTLRYARVWHLLSNQSRWRGLFDGSEKQLLAPNRKLPAPVARGTGSIDTHIDQSQRRRRVRPVLAALARLAAKRTPPGLSPTSTRTTVDIG